MKNTFIGIFVLLIGCASNSGVVPLGNDSYIIAKQAATGFSGTGEIKSKALKEASQQCLKQNKSVEIDKITESKPPYVFGNYPKIEITFHCLNNN